MDYQSLSKDELKNLQESLLGEYRKIQEEHLKLDMSRGKPGKEQLALSMGMLTNLTSEEDLLAEDGTDCRNYGVLDGIPEAKKLMASMLEVPPENVFVGGNASLQLMSQVILFAWIYGSRGQKPWSKEEKVRFLCPAPGYDRHFAITGSLGIEMIPIPMTNDGPDMDLVEKLVKDPSVKGIWCVPKYSNPDGITYSAETVRRFAALECAAPDFHIMWDNAYVVHHLDFDDQDHLENIVPLAKAAGREDQLYLFASTSKITFPGNGICALAASSANLAEFKKICANHMIGYDKIAQMRHVRFFKDLSGIEAHMKKHGAILKPRFQLLDEKFQPLREAGIGSWRIPKGGYFISLYTMEGCAKRTVQLCKEAGVVLTGAGAAYPYGQNPLDNHIRIAPTYPSSEELSKAADVLVLSARLAAIEKLLA